MGKVIGYLIMFAPALVILGAAFYLHPALMLMFLAVVTLICGCAALGMYVVARFDV